MNTMFIKIDELNIIVVYLYYLCNIRSTKSDMYKCSKYGFCIIIPDGIMDLRLIIMLLVGMS